MSDDLSKKLGYSFQQQALLTTALTHRSKGGEHNERLEFLGDAIVNFVTAEILYHQFPKATEGELSRWRASLVNRDTLAALAKNFDLGKFLFLGTGELKSGGTERQSILSCTMEAIIGAIYLDGGFEPIKTLISGWYKPLVDNLSAANNHKDPKTLLQEYVQSKHYALPIYTVEGTQGVAHQQTFTVSCVVNELKLKTTGKGTSRRRAEQEAAQAMLEVIKK